jgi:hypothetical protein
MSLKRQAHRRVIKLTISAIDNLELELHILAFVLFSFTVMAIKSQKG